MKRAARLRLGAAILVAGVLVACTFNPLNPQPLPPGPTDGIDFGADAGTEPQPQPLDGGVLASPTTGDDAGADLDGALPNAPAADAGDAGYPDASDAGDGGAL